MADFGPIETAIQNAQKHEHLKQHLRTVTVRMIVEKERVVVRNPQGTKPYPIRPSKLEQGFYFVIYDHGQRNIEKRPLPLLNANLSTGRSFDFGFKFGLVTGEPEFFEIIRSQAIVVWVTLDYERQKGSPSGAPPASDEFPLHLYKNLIRPKEVDEFLARKNVVKEVLTVPGPSLGSTQFWPGRDEPKPYNFRLEAHNGSLALLSRQYVGERFYYEVPAIEITQWVRSYVIDRVAASTAGMAVLVEMMADIAIGFMPLVGPLYNLVQAGRTAYDLYTNWDQMKGWQRALGALDVFLVTLDIPHATRVTKEALNLRKGVDKLVKAGVAADEARSLMIAADVLADSAAARKLVENLTDAMKKGNPLSVAEVANVERLFDQMVARLGRTERALAKARFAMCDLRSAREFLHGLEVTDEVWKNGLRRLTPEALVAIRGLAADGKARLALQLARWSMIDEVAAGMNSMAGTARLSHVGNLFVALHQDTLMVLGRGDFRIPTELADVMRRARTSQEAYKLLMRGVIGKRQIPGLKNLLEQARKLPQALKSVEAEFSHLYLSERELANLAKLHEKTRALLRSKAIFDSQIRELAAITGSDTATAAINRLTDAMGGKVKPEVLVGIYERLGAGMLQLAQKHNLKLTDQMIAAAVKQTGLRHEMVFNVTEILLRGPRSAKGTGGWLDVLVSELPSRSALEEALAVVAQSPLKAPLFARWAMRNSGHVPGVSVIKAVRAADAEKVVANIYSTFSPQVATEILAELGNFDPQAVAKIAGLKNFIGELAAGGSKSMGASLTLHYVVREGLHGKVSAFEGTLETTATRLATNRKYDLVADGIEYEFKYWTSLGGQKIEQSMDEFLRDIRRHSADGFVNLRWVFSHHVQAYDQAIQELMLTTLQKNRALFGKEFANIQRSLEGALKSGWLISYR